MEIEKEQEFLNLKSKLLSEIKYREEILRQLSWDSGREKGFVMNFIRQFLKIEKPNAPNLFWKDGETYGRYLIDADKDLNSDIQEAFKKSISKLKADYEKATTI
jgi:hypothetical protein